MLTEKPCNPTGVTHSDSGNEPKKTANNSVCRTYGKYDNPDQRAFSRKGQISRRADRKNHPLRTKDNG